MTNDGESDLRAHVEAGDLEAATTLFMERHGGEILAFLVVRLRKQSAASEVFSQFSEDFWRGLEGFRWRATLRSWGYTLARNAANRYLRSQRVRDSRLVHISRTPDCMQKRRSSTAPYLRTEVKKRLRALRRQLPADDQNLLMLRLDKGLSWNELAVIFSGEGDEMETKEMIRWAGRLRKRFSTIKGRLKTMARQEGLI